MASHPSALSRVVARSRVALGVVALMMAVQSPALADTTRRIMKAPPAQRLTLPTITQPGGDDLLLGMRASKLPLGLEPSRVVWTLPPHAIDGRGSKGRFGAAPWIMAGAGTALVGGAIGMQFARGTDQAAVDNAQTEQELADRRADLRRDKLTTRLLLGGGAALVLTGSALMLLNTNDPNATQFGVAYVNGGAAAAAKGRF